MSKVVCKGKYTSDVDYFLAAVEYAGEKIHTQKIHFKDGRIEDVQDDTMIDFSRYDVSEIEKISFILKDSETPINISVEKYQEKIKKPKASIKTSEIIEVDDFETENTSSECETGFLGYIDYTANRLGVEKESGTGLFDVGGNIAMDKVEEFARRAYDDGVRMFWMDIVSITREDGDRLGFNNRQAWKDLIISKAPEIAKAYNIPIENFHMYVGFHNNHKNSYHAHLSFHSMSSRDGYIKNGAEGGFEAASEKIKSVVLNTIFKDDVSEIKTLINVQRKNILHTLNNAMTNEFISDKLSNSFMFLAEDLKQYENGKSKYGYLKPTTKELVANVLKDIMEKDIDFKKLSAEYFASCEKQVRFYIDNDEQVNLRMESIKERFLNPDYHNNDSTAIHNTIIKFANKYNISDLSSQSRAIKGKIEFYGTPEENASDDFTSYEKIPDITDEYEELDDIYKHDQAQVNWNDTIIAEKSQDDIEKLVPLKDDENNEVKVANEEIMAFYKEKKLVAVKTVYEGCKDIFNPKVQNTFFQDELINQFEIIANKRDEIFHILNGNKNFRTKLQELIGSNKSLESNAASTSKAQNKKSVAMELSNGLNDIFAYVPNEITSLILDYVEEYTTEINDIYMASQEAARILKVDDELKEVFKDKNINANIDEAIFKYGVYWKDNKYYQLLDAYKEDFQPEYTKRIFKEINKNISSDFMKIFANDIKSFEEALGADYIKDEDISDFINNKISKFWADNIIETQEHSVYVENYTDVINENFDKKDANIYSKRFIKNIEGVRRRMTPHFLPLMVAKSLDEKVFSKQVRENKINTEARDYLKKTLFDAVKAESLIETQILQELLKIFKSEKDYSNEETLSIARTLYHMDNTFKGQLDNWTQKLQSGNNGDMVTQFSDVWRNYGNTDEQMTKLFLSSPIANTINGFGKSILDSYQKYHLFDFKEIQKNICKEAKETLFESIRKNGGAAKIFTEISDTLKIKDEETSYEETTAQIHSLMSMLVKENPLIRELTNSLRMRMLSHDCELVPKDIMEDYRKSVERSFLNGSLSFSFNAMLFGMARDAEKSYANATVKLFENEYKELQKMVSNQVYKAMQLPRSKLERDDLYSIVEKMGMPSIEKEKKELLARQAVIYMLKNNEKLAETVNYLESKFNETANGIAEEKKHQLFNDVFLFDSYTGVASTVAYMADKQDTLMTEIQATKKKIIIRSMCQAVAQIMYSSTRENERKLFHNNEDNKNLSKKRGNFSNRRSSLSSDLTFNNL